MKNYHYAIGRIRVLETRMLSEEKLLRMITAEDFSSALTILNETAYAEHLGKLSSPLDFEELISFELQSVKNLFQHLIPNNEIINSLWLKYDFQNIKLLLKLKYRLGSWDMGPGTLYQVGMINPGFLKNYILEEMGKFENLPSELIKLLTASIEQTKKTFSETSNPQMIDLILDRNYYLYLNQKAKSAKIPFFQKLVITKIDLLNLKTWLRIKALNKDSDLLQKSLLGGGIIEERFLRESFKQSPEDLTLRLKFTSYGEILSEGLSSPLLLEKLFDDYLINEFKKAKYFSFGVEPLIGFLLAKEQEMQTLRFILVGKQNAIESEAIKERISKL